MVRYDMSFESALNAGPAPLGPSAPSTAPAPEPLPRRIGDLFVRPRNLFEHLRACPVWAGPLLVSVLVGVLAIVLFPDQVFFESMQGATTRRGVPVEITSDASVVALWERLRLSLGVLVTTPVKMLLFAGLLSLCFGTSRGGEAGFRQFFALTAHVWLISAAGALLVLPLQLAAVDPGLSLSASLLVPGLPSLGVAGRAIAAVNPFTVWMLAAAAVGVAVLDRRPVRTPLTLLLGGYLSVMLALAAFGG